MEKLEVIVAAEDINVIEKINSIFGSFDKVGKITTCPTFNTLKPHLDRKVQGYLFVIDLTSDSFKTLRTKVESLIDEKNGQIIFVINDELGIEAGESQVNFIHDNFKMVELASKVSEVISAEPISYFPIAITSFYKANTFPCDIFVRIGMTKFIRIAVEGDKTDIDLLKKYEDKNISKLFVSEVDFFNKCQNLFGGELIAKKVFDNKDDYRRKSQEILHDMVANLGVNKFVMGQVDQAVEELEDDLKKFKMSEILKMLNDSLGTFIYDHSYMSLCFSRLLCKHMDWQSEEIRKKLSQACLLHDLGHENADDALLESSDIVKLKTLPDEKRDKILGHSEKMATLLEKNQNISQEVINLVRNHHEGLGPEESYPKGLTGVQLTQLDCVFIVSHALVVEMYKIAFNPKKFTETCLAIKNRYTSGHFKTVIKGFTLMVKEELNIKI